MRPAQHVPLDFVRSQFADLAADARLAGAARQLLASDVYLHLARATVLPGTFGEGYPWHSDFEGWHARDGMPSMRCVGAEVLLAPTDEHSGAMAVAPGSHRTFISAISQPGAQSPPGWEGRHEPDLYCMDAVLDRCGITRIDGPPGTVIIFDSNLLHASLANLSPDQAASIHARAENFIITGDGVVRAAVEQSILDGFLFVSTVGVGIAVFAVLVALSIRMRTPSPVARPVPEPVAAPVSGGQ